MQVTVSDQVRDYIVRHDTMTLSTTMKGKPWATPVFYQVDEDLRFYFVSDVTTRHIENALHNASVALAIYDQHQAWEEIQGVQIEGHLSRVADDDLPRVEALYFEKFPFVENILKGDVSGEAGKVRDGFLTAHFYVVTPEFVRLVDNTRGFAFKEEYYISLS